MTPTTDYTTILKGDNTMLLYEDLARARMREAEQAASELRLVRRLTAAKRWNRVSNWAAKRAVKVASSL
ncbi:hypothetical protein KIPE111705_45310 [Kibdelosporangium persicum]|jgi:hypothetical protein|uniref:hypothetical protein n=1 Tax=Kibdelosporangium persicum TaxID=2698649 RepID=UPI001563CB42|nr:hypothetical protein [Kibdelosporangium persicum]